MAEVRINRVPTIKPNVELYAPTVGLTMGNSRELAFQSVARAGVDLQQAADQTKLLADDQEASRVVSDLALSVDAADREIKQSTDHRDYLATHQARMSELQKQASQQAKGFGQFTQREFAAKVGGLFQKKEIEARNYNEHLQVRHGRAETMTLLDNAAEIASKATDPATRNQWLSAGAEQLLKAERSGFIDPVERIQFADRFKAKVIKGRQENFSTGLQNQLDDLSNKAFRDPVNAPSYEFEGFRAIEAAGGDWLPREKINEVKAKYRDQVWTGAIKTKILDNPTATRGELMAGGYDAKIDQQSLESLTVMADSEIERRRRQAEAERKENVRQIGKQVTDFKEAKMAGFDWAGNESQLAAAVRGTEHQAEFENVRQASKVLGQFNKLAPVEQETYLRSLSSQPMSGDGAKFASTLATAHERTKAGLKHDPITFAIKQRSVPGVGPLDLNNPASLKERSIVAGIVENRYSLQQTISPLSDDESDQLRGTLEKAPAEQQVRIFQQLKQGLEDRQIKAVASQLARKADPVLVQAMGLSVEAPEAASRILRGREILRDNKEIMPKGADLKSAQDKIASTLGEAYKNSPAHYSAVADSALSIYAFKSWQQRDLSGTIDTKRLEESIKEASGGVLQLGSFGGRYTVQAPRYGATEADFMDLLKRADYSKAKSMTKQQIIDHGRFESVGEGKYLVFIGPGPVHQTELNGAGNYSFVLDLNLPSRGAGGAALGGVAGMVK